MASFPKPSKILFRVIAIALSRLGLNLGSHLKLIEKPAPYYVKSSHHSFS